MYHSHHLLVYFGDGLERILRAGRDSRGFYPGGLFVGLGGGARLTRSGYGQRQTHVAAPLSPGRVRQQDGIRWRRARGGVNAVVGVGVREGRRGTLKIGPENITRKWINAKCITTLHIRHERRLRPNRCSLCKSDLGYEFSTYKNISIDTSQYMYDEFSR